MSTVAASFVGPAFLKEPPSRVDFANETGARIDCSAGGSPPPSISWLSGDGKPVGQIPQTRELLANGSLLFPPFRPSGYRHDVHAATYRCVAENSVGRIHSRDVRVRAGKSRVCIPGNRLPLKAQPFATAIHGCDVSSEFLSRCCRRFQSSGVLCGVTGWVLPDVSRVCRGLLFRVALWPWGRLSLKQK